MWKKNKKAWTINNPSIRQDLESPHRLSTINLVLLRILSPQMETRWSNWHSAVCWSLFSFWAASLASSLYEFTNRTSKCIKTSKKHQHRKTMRVRGALVPPRGSKIDRILTKKWLCFKSSMQQLLSFKRALVSLNAHTEPINWVEWIRFYKKQARSKI